MKPTTSAIKSALLTEGLIEKLDALTASHTGISHGEMIMQEASDAFKALRAELLDIIEQGKLDDISSKGRNNISGAVQHIVAHINSNQAPNFIQQVDNLMGFMDTLSGIRVSFQQNFDAKKAVKDVLQLKVQYQEAIAKYEKAVEDYKNIQEAKGQINGYRQEIEQARGQAQSTVAEINQQSEQAKQQTRQIIDTLNNYLNQQSEQTSQKTQQIIDTLNNNLNQQSEQFTQKAQQIIGSISANQGEVDAKLNAVRISEQEVNDRKNNVIDFDKKIDETSKKLQVIYAKEEEEKATREKLLDQARALIKQAEEALELKETEGIAKAYSSRLSNLTKSNKKSWWIGGAVFFVVTTFIFAFFLVGGDAWGIKFPASDNLSFVIGRIFITFLGISGAAFCAKQYLTLEKLEEDYEYKVVLSKSILAFSNKIKEIDNSKVEEYLKMVLTQLHQDPLRTKEAPKSEMKLEDAIKLVNEAIETVKKMPGLMSNKP